MHIVFLSHEYPLWSPGGIGTFIQTFGRALVEEGHRVSVVGPGRERKEIQMEDRGVQLFRLPKKIGLLPGFWHNSIQLNRKLKSLHEEVPIDIIESAELGLAFISGNHNAMKVIRLHGGHHFFAEAEKRGIDKKKGYLERRSFKKADGFIAVSNYVKEHTAKFLSYNGKPLTVIPHLMETTMDVPAVDINKNKLLFAGTVCEKKGVRELIQAFELIRKRFPEMELDIYGRDWFYQDGRSYIESIQLELPKEMFYNVTFHGSIPREKLFLKYAEAAVCVFPSHMETQGLVTLEAMLMSKPVVFTEYGPGPETIDHGRTGLLCDVYDPSDISRKVLQILEDYDWAIQLGTVARHAVLEKYDRTRILEQNLKFYNQLM